MQTLLQKAKEIKSQKQSVFKASREMEELVLAWCRDEVSLTQVARALGLNNTGYRTYSKIALTLKHYLKRKRV